MTLHADRRTKGIALRVLRGCAFVCLAFVGSACGGSDDEADTDGNDAEPLAGLNCAIPVALSGAVDVTIPKADLACAYSASYGSETSTMLIPASGAVESISLDFEDITRGQLGVFPLVLTIRLDAGGMFVANDCTADVTTHDPTPDKPSELGDVYRLAGRGTCAAAAVSDDETEVIEIADFDFVSSIVWGE